MGNYKHCLVVFLTVLIWMAIIVFLQSTPKFSVPGHPPRALRPRGCLRQDFSKCLTNPYTRICRQANVTMEPYYDARSPTVFSDILLIIVFNSPMYELIPMLEFMYRRHFEHILYCGDFKAERWDSFDGTFPRKLDFVEVHFVFGQLGYMCMMEAVKRNYSVKGYLHLSDDVLLNMWNIRHLPRNVPWFYESVMWAWRNQTHVPDIWKDKEWYPWSDTRWGYRPLARTWRDLEDIASNGTLDERILINSYLARLATSVGSKDKVYYYPSDVWYLPVSKGKEFSRIIEVFLRHEVFHEIAIPTVLHGLGLPIKYFSGTYLWFYERGNFTENYSAAELFFHPFKLKTYLQWKSGPIFMCKNYLPHIIRDLLS